MRKPLRAFATASLIAALPIAAQTVAPATPSTSTTATASGATTAAAGASAAQPACPPSALRSGPRSGPALSTKCAVGARLTFEPEPVVDGISANGERIPGETTVISAPIPAAALAAPSIESAQVDLDRAVRRETRRTQRTVAPNEQRLYTIAPRTTVDRSAEMPNDPVSPAISPPRIQY